MDCTVKFVKLDRRKFTAISLAAEVVPQRKLLDTVQGQLTSIMLLSLPFRTSPHLRSLCFVLICGSFFRIPNHQHRVGTHAPSLCARRFRTDAIFASAQLFISTGAGMKESSLLITELTNLILPMRKCGTSPNPRQKSWILLRQAISFTLLLATKNCSFWASIARLITSLTLKYSELARGNNPSPKHRNEWMVSPSNLVFWADFEEIHKSKDFSVGKKTSPFSHKVPVYA